MYFRQNNEVIFERGSAADWGGAADRGTEPQSEPWQREEEGSSKAVMVEEKQREKDSDKDVGDPLSGLEEEREEERWVDYRGNPRSVRPAALTELFIKS